MNELEIIDVIEIGNENHKARICSICYKNIKKKKNIFKVDTRNSYNQTRIRYACRTCSLKFIKKNIKEIPEWIKIYKEKIKDLKNEKIQYRKWLSNFLI